MGIARRRKIVERTLETDQWNDANDNAERVLGGDYGRSER
jgi:hypothetical protein